MKIFPHPRMFDVGVGDEVYSYERQLFARVEEIFPAAVCVKVAILSVDTRQRVDISVSPQLWRADDIENLSICRYCGAREELELENETGIPFRVCERCRVVPPAEHSPDVGRWW